MRRAVLVTIAMLAGCGDRPAQRDSIDTDVGDGMPVADEMVAPGLRLPDGVEPTGYQVRLDIDPDGETFTGRVEVAIDLKAASEHVWIHAVDLDISRIAIDAAGTTRTGKVIGNGDQMIAVDLGGTAGPGPVTLTFDYAGKIGVGAGVEGLFKQRYQGRWYVYTQFEAVQARRAMPCFDEPRFKVPWQITLVVPRHLEGFGNAPVARETRDGDRRVIELAPTPPLPSYLIAVAVGPFVTFDVGPVGRDRVPARIIALAGTPRAAAATAIVLTPKIVTYLEDYFDRPLPYAKLDQIAVPRFFGAMENPGLITYARRLLLVDDKRRAGFAELAGHEIAHQWFGNLVTPSWWGDIWLNESFATWMATKVVAALVPGKGRQVAIGWQYEEAMDADVRSSAPPLGNRPLATNEEAENAFDTIAYEKGGAVLGMFEAWIGEARMQAAIRAYIERDAGKTTDTSRFLDAVEGATDATARAVLASFVEQSGVPLISIELACDGAPKLVLAQERLVDGTPVESTWRVPVCVRYATGDGSREACGVIDGATGELALPEATACPAWIVGNANGRGYYRVRHVGSGALAASWKQLSTREKIVTAGSLEAMVEGGRVTPDDVVEALPMLLASGTADDEITALSMVAATVRLVAHERRPAWRTWARRVLAASLARTGGTARVRNQRYWFATMVLEDPPKLAAARATAARWSAGGAPKFDADAILRAAVRGGDREVSRRIAVRARTIKDKELKRTAVRALGATLDPDAARDAFAVVLDDAFTAGDVAPIVSWLGVRPATRAVLLELVVARIDDLVARFTADDVADTILPAFDTACDRDEREHLAKTLGPIAQRLEDGSAAFDRMLATIDACIARRDKHGARMEELIR